MEENNIPISEEEDAVKGVESSGNTAETEKVVAETDAVKKKKKMKEKEVED